MAATSSTKPKTTFSASIQLPAPGSAPSALGKSANSTNGSEKLMLNASIADHPVKPGAAGNGRQQQPDKWDRARERHQRKGKTHEHYAHNSRTLPTPAIHKVDEP